MEGYKSMQVLIFAPSRWLLESNPDTFKEMCIVGLAIRAQEIFNGLASHLSTVLINFNNVQAKIYRMGNGYWIRRNDWNLYEAMVSN